MPLVHVLLSQGKASVKDTNKLLEQALEMELAECEHGTARTLAALAKGLMQEEAEETKKNARMNVERADDGDADTSVMMWTPKEKRALKLMIQAAMLDPEKGVCMSGCVTFWMCALSRLRSQSQSR